MLSSMFIVLLLAGTQSRNETFVRKMKGYTIEPQVRLPPTINNPRNPPHTKGFSVQTNISSEMLLRLPAQ